MLRNLILSLLIPALFVPASRAATTPAQPHGDLVAEVVAFLMSDVGDGGIRTYDDDPQGEPAPPYFYHYAIGHDDGLDSNVNGYPGYASISYPGYTTSIAIDAFLAWWIYSGEPEGLARARQMADWLLARRTPSGDLYGDWPYSTQTDGVMGGGYDGDAVMSDKPGMFGLRCLQLFDVTGDSTYFHTAREIADTYVVTQMQGPVEDHGRWPFRVRPSDGVVRQDYTSHLVPAVRLLAELAGRTGQASYTDAADRGWTWLERNPLDPASPHYMHWEGFYEDIGPISAGLGDHYSAGVTATALIERDAPGDLATAIAIGDTITARFLAPDGFQNGDGFYHPSMLEWEAWMNTTYAATAQWAVLNLRLAAATEGTASHDPVWATRGRQALHTLTYGQAPASRVPTDDGRMLTTIRELTQPFFGTETWYEQNFNVVLYLLEAFALAPDLAPDDENHILAVEGFLPTSVSYTNTRIEYDAGGAGSTLLKLAARPSGVRIDGQWLPDPGATSVGSWSYDEATRLCRIEHAATDVVVQLGGVTASTPVPPSKASRLLPNRPNPFNPRTTLRFELAEPGDLSLVLFDAAGRKVRDWHFPAHSAGEGSVVWDGADERDRGVGSGVYYLRLRAGATTDGRRILLLR